MRIFDLDGLFEKFVKNYIKENNLTVGDDFDDLLVEIYEKFDSTVFDELDGKTPVEFFEDETADYGKLLLEYYNTGTEVSDYFVDGAVKCAKEDDLIALIDPSLDEDIVITAIDILDKKGSKKAFNRYIDLLFDKKTDSCIVDKIVETLKYYADEVADEILSRLTAVSEPDSVFAEILSCCKIRREGIRSLLLSGLIAGDRIPEYCSYLVSYGDESAADTMKNFAETVDEYVSYKELSLAVEALGGAPLHERNFDDDLDYLAILKAQKQKKDDEDKN